MGAGTGSQSSNLGILSTSEENKFRQDVGNSSNESLVQRKRVVWSYSWCNLIAALFLDRLKNVHITDPREVQFLTPTAAKSHNFKDDRILMTTRKTPFFLFSVLPYHKGKENRKDPRRRQISGARPLSSINDAAFDPFDLLGIQRGESGQEVSYGHLLVPSKPHAKEKKNGMATMIPEGTIEFTNFHAMKNHAVAR